MSHPLPSFRHLDTSPRTEKGWGEERLIVNREYCGKLLRFNKGSKLSMHIHFDKHECFLVTGRIIFRYIDTSDASVHEQIMENGAIVEVPRMLPHQVEALEDSVITEFSTHHSDDDSFRVSPGNSQQPAKSA